MENTKYGKRREGRWTPIRAKAQDTRANPNSWETHLLRKRWDIGLLRALGLRIMMMMMMMMNVNTMKDYTTWHPVISIHSCILLNISQCFILLLPVLALVIGFAVAFFLMSGLGKKKLFFLNGKIF